MQGRGFALRRLLKRCKSEGMKYIHSHLWPGVPLALVSAVLFGASAPFAKLLLGTVSPQLLAGLLYLGAGIGLAIVHVSRATFGVPAQEAPLRRHDLPWLAAVVLFGGLAGPLLLMLGLSHTSAASGSLLLNLEGLATMLIAWVVFRENVDRRLMLGAFAILAGAAVLSWSGEEVRFDAGAMLIAAACVAWGIDNNLTRKLSSSDPVIIAMIKGLAAGCVNVCLALLLGAAVPSASTIGGAAVVGFLGVGVSLVLFMLALRHLGAARTGAYFSLAPFIGAQFARGRTFETTYYDTPDNALSRAGMALRVRRAGRRRVMTLKWPPRDEGVFARGEDEAIIHADAPQPELLGPQAAAMIAEATL